MDIDTTGVLTFNDAITAGSIALDGAADVDLATGAITLDTSAANGVVTFATAGNVDGGQDLTISAGSGAVSLAGVGQNTAIGALNIDATGTTTLNGDIDASSIALDGAADVDLATGAITLDTSAANGLVDLTGGAVDGAQDLTITAGSGAVSLDGVGQNTAIGALDIDTTGVLTFNDAVTAGSIALDGAADVDLATGAITLDTSAANGVVTFATAGNVDGGQDLTISAGSGAVNLSAMGASTAIGALDVDSTGTTTLNGDIDASSIALDGAADVDLATGAITLDTSAANGTVDLTGGAVDGAQNLTITAGSGAVSLAGVGQNTAIGALNIDATGTTTLNGDIDASSIALDGATDVDLATGAITLDTSAANGLVDLTGGAVDGAQDLTITAGSGAVSLDGVGQNTAIGALDIDTTGVLTFNDSVTAVSIALDGAADVDLATGAITLDTSAANGVVTFATAGNVDGGQNLKISAGSGAVNLSAMGASTAIGALDIDSTGTTTVNGNIDAGSIALDGAADVDLATGAITLDTSAANGTVDLTGGAVDGGQDLTISAGSGAVSLDGMGQNVKLTSLNVSSSGLIDVNDAISTNAGVITLVSSDDINFAAAADLSSGNGNVNITADSDDSTSGSGGALTMADGASVNSGTGTISLSADEDITIGGLTSTHAGGVAITITSDSGSIIDAGDTDVDITASTVGGTVTLEAKSKIGSVSGGLVYLDPSDSGYAGNPLETAILSLSASTSATTGNEIALDNTSSSGLTLTELEPGAGGTGNTGSAWIRNSAALDVSNITITNTVPVENYAFIATTGDLTLQNSSTPLSVGTTGVLKLEAVAGDVKTLDSANLSVTAKDFILKSNTQETLSLAVTNFDGQITGSTSGSGHDLVVSQASGDLTVSNFDGSLDQVLTKNTSLYAEGKVTVTTTAGSIALNDGVFANTESLNFNVGGAGKSFDLASSSNAYIRSVSGTNITVSDGDLNMGTVDGKSVDLYTSGGDLNLDISSPLAERTLTIGDDDTTDPVSLLIEGNINITNDGDSSSLNPGSILLKKDSSITASFNQSGLNTGNVSLTGSVTTDGTMNVEQTRNATLTAKLADLTIKETGIVGGGSLTLNPGSENDIIVQEGGVISVTSSDTLPGSLTIGSAASPIAKFDMQGTTSKLNLDGSAAIYAKEVILTDVVIDADGDGGNVDSTTASQLTVEATEGDVVLNGLITANAVLGGVATKENDVVIKAPLGSITNTSGKTVAIEQVDSLTLEASGSIGTVASPISINSRNIIASSSSSGNIYLSNTPNVLSGTADPVTIDSMTTSGATIFYKQQGGSLVIGSNVGDTAISSVNGNIVIDPPTSITLIEDIDAGSGNITLQATGSIDLTTGDLITNGGTVLVQADSDLDGVGDLSISQGTSATDARIISGSGNIQLRGEHIALNDFSALTSGEIEVIAGQGVSSTGEIFSASAANNSYDLSAASFDLESKGAGIGESGGSTLEILSNGATDAESDGNVHITSVNPTNPFKVGFIDAGTNDVTIISSLGVTDDLGTGSDAATDIIATNLTVNNGSTGSAGDITLDTAVTNLDLKGDKIYIHEGAGINVNSISSSADLTLVANDAITQSVSGAIDADSTSSFTSLLSDISLTNLTNDFSGAVSLITTGSQVAMITDANDILLGNVSIGDALTINATGSITDSGNLNVGGLATIASNGNLIELGDGTNANFGILDFSGSVVSITESSDMLLAASEATGILTLNAGLNDISQTGVINASDAVNLTGGDIILTQDNNLGSIKVLNGSGDLSITESDAVDGIQITSIERTSGDLSLDSGVNAITQTDKISIDDGTITLTGGSIDLTNSNNEFGSIEINSGAGNIEITENDAISIAGIIRTDGDLTLNAGTNGISQSGAISIDDGEVTLSGGAINLAEANVLGSVSITSGAGAVSLAENDAISIAGISRTDGDLTLNAGTNGISQSGVISIDDGAVTLSGGVINLAEANVLGSVSITSGAGAVSLAENDAISIAGITRTDGDLTLNAGTNGISQSGIISIGAGAVALSGGAISLAEANVLGSVSITSGAGAVSLTENDAISIAGITRTDGDLTLNAGTNGISQSGIISIGAGAVTLSGGVINLAEANVLGSVSITSGAGAVSLTENDAISIAGISRTDGDLTLNAGTNGISQSGAISIDDGAVILLGGAISLAEANVLGSVSITSGAGAVSLTENDAISIAGITRTDGDLTLNAGTNGISQSGVISIDDGAVTLSGGVINLAEANVLGSVSITSGAGAVSLAENEDISIAGIIRTDGDLSLNAGTNGISQSGAISIDNGAVTLRGGAITLEKANVLGSVSITSGAGAVSLTENDAISIAGITRTDGDLTLNAGTNGISQSGVISIDDGAVTLSGGVINLAEANVLGSVSITSGAGAVSLTENDAISIAGISRTDGDLTLNAGTNGISQSGAISIDDGAVILLGGAISLAEANVLGSVSITSGAGAVSLTENDAISIAGISRTDGDLTLNAGTNGISQSGVISIDDGAVTLSGGAINLAEANVLGTVSITSGAGAVSLAENEDISIAGIIRTDGDLSLDAGTNGISQSGAISIDNGAVTLRGGAITLEKANMLGDVTISTGAGTLVLTENDAISIAGITRTDGDLTLNAGTNGISQSGAISIDDGSLTVNAGAIELEQDNLFDNLSINSSTGIVSIKESNGLTVADSSVSGQLDLISAGAISLNRLDAGENTVIVTSSGSILDSNDEADNLIAGALTVNAGSSVTIDTKVSSAVIASTGSIDLDESDAIVLTDIDTIDGTISVTAGGAITVVDVATGNNNAIALTASSGDIAGLAIINTGSGTVTLNSAGSITDDADDTTMISSGVLDATASTGGIKIDTSVEVANFSADGDIDLNEADSIAVSITGSTNKVAKIEAGGSITSTSIEAQSVDLISGGSIDTSGLKTEVLQTSAHNGIAINSEGVSHFAATSTSGDISLTNTGGFSVSDLASIGTVDFENELSGVSLTDPNANGKISIVANSPLSIDASIDAKMGSILLAASGQTDTDDVSISNNIKAGSIEIYAGDSILFNEIASIDANDVSLNVSTNFDSLSSLTSNGTTDGKLVIPSLYGTSNLEIFTPAVGKIRNGMIHQFSHRGMTYMENYLNTMNPTQDDYNINEQIGGREFITNVYFENSSSNSGKIEKEEIK